MKEPDHKVKRHVVPLSNKQKPYWIENPVHGWLASGIVDRNGKEIFEGDRVSVSEHKHPFTVMFADGKFWLGNSRMKCHLTYFHNSKIEVVGHVAEDES